jgi:hypothetical protein
MNDHGKLYEIVQKVFNAGQKFEKDTQRAFVGCHAEYPSAYPVITPLIEELVEYVDQFAKEEVDRVCRNIAKAIPFRSVEILDGSAKVVE